MDRCRYPSKPCLNARAVKLNGELHRFCEQHRRQANQNQMRWSKRKQTVLRSRRGDGEDGDEDDGRGSDGADTSDGGGGPPSLQHPHQGGMPPGPPMHAFNSSGNVHAAGASLSHLSLGGHGGPLANGGLISSFQDHMARGGAIPGTNGVNIVLGGGGVRRELASAPRNNGGGPGMVPHPIQTALPPLLPPRAVEQPDPTAVHALLMLEHAANVVTSNASATSSQREPERERMPAEADDGQVRRELKRAKSNEWIARPTLSPAGLPTVSSLVNHGPSGGSATASSSSASSMSAIGRSASWQPPQREHESLGQWMQRKQASLPSLTNIARIEKRPYDSISTSAQPPLTSSGFLHRGPETGGVNINPASNGNYTSGSSHRGAYVQHQAPPPTKSASGSGPVEGTKRSALV